MKLKICADVRWQTITANIKINAIIKSKMEKKQSSVEWLEQQLNAILKQSNIEIENVIWQQAKAMHKEEVMKAFVKGTQTFSQGQLGESLEANIYYIQTFEK